ncbi:MAG: hypothetical protein R2711_09950 [Acidimicrobiales bacterium]
MRDPEHLVGEPEHVVALVTALLDPALEPIVDLVVTADGEGYEARAVDGRVRFRREADGHGWSFAETEVEGRNPLGDRATDRFVGLDVEMANPTRAPTTPIRTPTRWSPRSSTTPRRRMC